MDSEITAPAAPPKKHIIHIMADDLGRDNLGKLNNGMNGICRLHELGARL